MAYPYSTKQDKYPNGYLPKIQYWAEVMAEACNAADAEAVEYAKSKLDYFFAQHCRQG